MLIFSWRDKRQYPGSVVPMFLLWSFLTALKKLQSSSSDCGIWFQLWSHFDELCFQRFYPFLCLSDSSPPTLTSDESPYFDKFFLLQPSKEINAVYVPHTTRRYPYPSRPPYHLQHHCATTIQDFIFIISSFKDVTFWRCNSSWAPDIWFAAVLWCTSQLIYCNWCPPPRTKECLLPTKIDLFFARSIFVQFFCRIFDEKDFRTTWSIIYQNSRQGLFGSIHLSERIGRHFIGYLSHPSRMEEIKGSIDNR